MGSRSPWACRMSDRFGEIKLIVRRQAKEPLAKIRTRTKQCQGLHSGGVQCL